MAWIESHQSLERHPKVLALQERMGWSLDETLGKLHRFWWWCLNYAEDGDLRRYSAAKLGAVVGLNGDASQVFIHAMIDANWFDTTPFLRVHDWWDYIGRFLQSKYKHRPERWQKIKGLYQYPKNRRKGGSKNGSKNPQGGGSLHPIPNLPNLPNLPNPPLPPPRGGRGFEEFWEAYPRKVGKTAALKAWRRVRPDLAAVLAALESQKRSPDWHKDGGQFIPNPTTWLNQGRWEDQPLELQESDEWRGIER